jgi:hypothetical protein
MVVQVTVPKPLRPTLKTLAKYGLKEPDWDRMVSEQGGVCYVCQSLPKTRRLVIDHEHVRGWKKKPPKERSRYVRGLLCNRCNWQFLRRGLTYERSVRITQYLHQYQKTGTEIKVPSQESVKVPLGWIVIPHT